MNLPVFRYIQKFVHDLNTKFFSKKFRPEISMLLVACLVFAGTASYIPAVSYTDTVSGASSVPDTSGTVPTQETLPDPVYIPSDNPETETDAYEDVQTVTEREFTPAPYVLNFAYEYPEGSDISYAETLIRELIQKDSQWYAGMYDQANISPETMASALGRSYSSVMGSYNPSVKSQDPDDPSTWVISHFTNVNISFLNGDGQYTSAVSNAQEILSMASVYAYYNDITDLSEVRKYTDQLWSASHSYSVSMGDVYYCSGCVSADQPEEEEEAGDSELEGEDTFIYGRSITTEIGTGNSVYMTENGGSDERDLQEASSYETDHDETEGPAGPGEVTAETGSQTESYIEDDTEGSDAEPESSVNVIDSLAETAGSVIYEEERHQIMPEEAGETEETSIPEPEDVKRDNEDTGGEDSVGPGFLETVSDDDASGIDTISVNPAAAYAGNGDMIISPFTEEEETDLEASAVTEETETAASETTAISETTTAAATFSSSSGGLKNASNSGSAANSGDDAAAEETATASEETTTVTEKTTTAAEETATVAEETTTVIEETATVTEETTTAVEETTTVAETTAEAAVTSEIGSDSGLKRASTQTGSATETSARETTQTDSTAGQTSSDNTSGVTRITTGTTGANTQTSSELVCPGHIDLHITARITTLSDSSDLFSVDRMGNTVEEGSNWQGWTARNKSLVNHINRQDWMSVYGLDIIMENSGTPLTDLEIESYMKLLPPDISDTRRELIRFALESVGKIPYYWGGKASSPNYTGNNFGSVTVPDYRGRILRGLDCSGWVSWVYWSVTGERLAYESTDGMNSLGRQVARADLQPGDIILITGSTPHVIMFLSWTENGQILCIHESSTYGNVTVGVMTANWPYYRNLLD